MTRSANLYEPGEVLMTQEEIAEVVARLGREITADYEGKNPVLVNLLKGGVVFLADLIRQLPIPHQIDFMRVSSYENGTSSSGVVRIAEDLSANISGRHVLVVEDVLDTGRTLAYILDMLELRSPKSFEVCSLLRKTFAAEHPRPGSSTWARKSPTCSSSATVSTTTRSTATCPTSRRLVTPDEP